MVRGTYLPLPVALVNRWPWANVVLLPERTSLREEGGESVVLAAILALFGKVSIGLNNTVRDMSSERH